MPSSATATTEIYTLSLHDALPISPPGRISMEAAELERVVSEAYRDRERLRAAAPAVEETIALLDAGRLRVAEKVEGAWRVNAWVKRSEERRVGKEWRARWGADHAE